MVLTPLRGALGFLTRVPVGHDERAWDAFRRSPITFPAVGYIVGSLLALPYFLPVPAPTVAFLFVAWLYVLTGITHADGLADLGDAVVVHGDVADRRAVLKDTSAGVGAVLSLTTVLFGLGLAALALATEPWMALRLVVVAEVGAKLGMALVACFGTATHQGLGSALTGEVRPRSFFPPAVVALPAAFLTWPDPAAGVTLGAGVLASGLVHRWARHRLDGVNGDVLGASNELARVVGLHAGVIAWMHY